MIEKKPVCELQLANRLFFKFHSPPDAEGDGRGTEGVGTYCPMKRSKAIFGALHILRYSYVSPTHFLHTSFKISAFDKCEPIIVKEVKLWIT